MPALTDCLATWLQILAPAPGGKEGSAAEVDEAWRFHAFCDGSGVLAGRDLQPRSSVALWLENEALGRAWLALPLGKAFRSKESGQLISEGSVGAMKAFERRQTASRTDAGHPPASPSHLAIGMPVSELSIASTLAMCLSPSHAWWLPEMQSDPSVPTEVQRGWHRERAVLVDSLLRARCLIAGELHWLLVPCSLWSAAARVLASGDEDASRGVPPKEVLDDWVSQWSKLQSQRPSSSSTSVLPSLPDTLLSQQGWLCSLSTLCESISSSLGLDRDPQSVHAWLHRYGIVPQVVTWPTRPKSEQNVAPKCEGERSDLASEPIASAGQRQPTAPFSEANASRANDSDAIESSDDPLRMPKRSQIRAKRPRNRQRAIHPIGLVGAVGGAGLLASIAIAVWFWPQSAARTSDNLARSPSQASREAMPQPSSVPSSRMEHASGSDALASSGRSEARLQTSDKDTSPSDSGPSDSGPSASGPSDSGSNDDEPLAITSLDTFEDASQRNASPAAIGPSLTGLLADLDRRIAKELGPRTSVDRDATTEQDAPVEDLSVELTTDSIVERSIATDATEGMASGIPPGAPGSKTRLPADPLDANPPPGGDEPAAGAEDAVANAVDPVATDGQSNLTQRIRLRLGFQRLDAKVGKGVHAKQASAIARLQMAEDVLPEVQLVPSDEVSLTGSATSEWRVAIEDAQPELIVRLSSRPNAKWQLAAQVGVQLSPLQDPMPLGPSDAANVLQNLALYRTWLERTIETLSNMPSPPRAIGGPDRIALLRHYRAQWKETEKAIEAWQVVQRLSKELFQYASIEIRLQPQPASGDAP